MSDLNDVQIQGRLGQDPELKTGSSGKRFVNFSLAVKGFKDDDTTWVDCTAFDGDADFMGTYLKKGSMLIVNGRLKTRSWEDKDTGAKRSKLEVIAKSVHGVGKPADANVPSNGQPADIPF